MKCRFCKNYLPIGRNGGYCNFLTVPVQGKWDSCRLYLEPFSESPIAVANLARTQNPEDRGGAPRRLYLLGFDLS